MNLSQSAVAIFVFSAVSTGVAEASLTGADLAAANSYFNSHPDIAKYAPWIRDGVLAANSLKDANYTLLSNSYYDQAQGKVIYVNQIGVIAPPVSMSTLTPSTPAQVKLTTNIPVVTTSITAVTNTKTTLSEPGVISAPTNTINTASIITTTTKQPLIIEPSKAILATHLDGQHNLVINGRDGRPGKNGVTDIITKKEVDTKTSKQVNINTQTLKALSVQSTAQAKDLKAAQQVFAQTQANTHSQFKNLKDEVDGNKKEARGGVASAVAMASMPQVEKDQAVMFSAGAGEFRGEEAVSVGASFHAGSAVVKAGMSDSTNNDFAMGVGVGIGF